MTGVQTCALPILACDVGEWFSFTGHGFIRINLATHTKNVRTAVERIVTNIKERQQ